MTAGVGVDEGFRVPLADQGYAGSSPLPAPAVNPPTPRPSTPAKSPLSAPPHTHPCSSVAILNNTAWSYAAIPLIWVFMLLIRAGCLVLFNPIFKWVGEGVCVCV